MSIWFKEKFIHDILGKETFDVHKGVFMRMAGNDLDEHIENNGTRDVQLALKFKGNGWDVISTFMPKSRSKMFSDILLKKSSGWIIWGSEKFWSLIPEHINAITICSKGEMNFYKENYGHYASYRDKLPGDMSLHKASKKGLDPGQHWFVASIHTPVEPHKIDFFTDHKEGMRWDASTLIPYRIGTQKKDFDLNNIDWSLVPDWATQVVYAKEKFNGEYLDRVEFWDNTGYIRESGNICGHYMIKDGTRPSNHADDKCAYGDYNYNMLNFPEVDTKYQRPAKI